MGHYIRGVVAMGADAAVFASVLDVRTIAPLAGGLAFVPLTDRAFDALADVPGDAPVGFEWLTPKVEAVLLRAQAVPSFAWVETEYFGGVGTQAADAGYSRPLLDHHVKVGRFLRIQRGIYRLRDFPSADHEDVVVAWLWSDQQGVVSHESALLLHGLSDVLPARIDLAVPTSWRGRRIRVPVIVRLHHADVADADRAWSGPVPVTKPLRTLVDCVADHIQPDLVAQAVRDGLRRGLFTARQLTAAGVPT